MRDPLSMERIPWMSDQKLRILRSGLKPEPGAWERSILNMEMASGQWGRSQEDIEAEKRRLAVVRRRHTIVKKTLPKPRKKADNFRLIANEDAPNA